MDGLVNLFNMILSFPKCCPLRQTSPTASCSKIDATPVSNRVACNATLGVRLDFSSCRKTPNGR
jgi:hypothetical protein